MAYTASALTRNGGRWSGADLDLSEIEEPDGLVELLRELAEGADVLIMFLEENDEYVAVVRLADDDEPRVFVSDQRVVEGDGVAGRLLGEDLAPEPVELDEPDPDAEEDEEDEGGRPEVEPGGDASLLADLGVGAAELRELCAAEGMLPSDVIFTVCEKLGCADVLEQVRGL